MTRARRPAPALETRPGPQKGDLAGDGAAAAAMDGVEADRRDLAAAVAGDEDAFGRLYDRHAAVVLALCRRLALAEAEDAMQETFIRAHRKLHHVESGLKLRPWLYAIARRVCSERARSRRRRARQEEAFAVSRAAEPPPASAPAEASEQAARAEDLRRLDAALDRLPDRERLAIHLYYLEADPVQAASSALGLSRSGYYKMLSRARESLGRLMTETSTPASTP